VAVDIWSLSVVACHLLCDLPPIGGSYQEAGSGVRWYEAVVEWLQIKERKRPTALGWLLLLSNMLVVSQESRLSANQCYHETVGLPSAEDTRHPPKFKSTSRVTTKTGSRKRNHNHHHD
jgi:hypothetical protein